MSDFSEIKGEVIFLRSNINYQVAKFGLEPKFLVS